MYFNIYNSLIIAGIIQGFVFAIVVLLSKKYRSKSTILLTALIVIYSIGNLQYVLAEMDVLSELDMYKYMFLPVASIIPVLILFYVSKFIYPNKIIAYKLWWFIPFILAMAITFCFRILFLMNNDHQDLVQPYILFIRIHEILSVVYSLILVSIATKKVIFFERNQEFADTDYLRGDLKWLRYTLLFILFFTLIWGYLTYINIFIDGSSPNFYILWIAIAATVYWFGHLGIYKYGIIHERMQLRAFSKKDTTFKSKNAREGSSKIVHNKYINKLHTLFENEKIFLDPELTLQKLSDHLELSSSYVSRIINKELNTNFSDYINGYRIETAKQYLKNPEFSKYTITAIGLEAGFNSRSSFYNVFKKVTGKTPSAFKKENL